MYIFTFWFIFFSVKKVFFSKKKIQYKTFFPYTNIFSANNVYFVKYIYFFKKKFFLIEIIFYKVYILFGPEALLGLREDMMLAISSLSVGCRNTVLLVSFER